MNNINLHCGSGTAHHAPHGHGLFFLTNQLAKTKRLSYSNMRVELEQITRNDKKKEKRVPTCK